MMPVSCGAALMVLMICLAMPGRHTGALPTLTVLARLRSEERISTL